MARPPSEETLRSQGLDRWGFPIAREITIVQHPKPAPRTQAGRGSFSDETLLPGLRRMSVRQTEGQVFSRYEIARECGVSETTIRLLERAALRKLRARLGPAMDSEAKEFFANYEENNE